MFSRPNFMPRRSRLKIHETASVGLAPGSGGSRRRSRDGGWHELGTCFAAGGKAQQPRQRVLELAAIDDHVEHAVLEQELAALEAFRQLLPDRLLDDPGA